MTRKEQQKLIEQFLKTIKPKLDRIQEKIIHTYMNDAQGRSPFKFLLSPIKGPGISIDLQSCYFGYLEPYASFWTLRMDIHTEKLEGARSQLLQKYVAEFHKMEQEFMAYYDKWNTQNEALKDKLHAKD